MRETNDEAPRGAGPIAEGIEDYYARGERTIGLPAHGTAHGAVRPGGARALGDAVFRADVGMEKGIDDRRRGRGVMDRATAAYAAAVGADETIFSTGGSSQSVRAAVLAAVSPGGTIVMARNGHVAATSALVMSGARPAYVEPTYDADLRLAHGVAPDELRRVLDGTPEAEAVLVFSPTYYGIGADVAGLAGVAHAHGVPLIVDEAWGASYAFCDALPPSAISRGADLTMNSVHKSLSALCQTSVMHRSGARIDAERLRLAVELDGSTSISAVLLCSIDEARVQFERDGEALLGAAIQRAGRLRAAIGAIEGLRLVTEDVLDGAGAWSLDPTHVLFDVSELGTTGFAAADWLLEHHGLHVELADHRRLLVLVTYAAGDETVQRTEAALRDLADRADDVRATVPDVPYTAALRMPTEVLPRAAILGRVETVDLEEAAGRVAAEIVCPFPPGIPVAAPGERLTSPVVDYLRQVMDAGAVLDGVADRSLRTMRVVREETDG